MIKNQLFELTYYAPPPRTSLAEVDLYATFSVNDKEITVKGFYDGEGVYKIRFLPQQEGEYHWRVYGGVLQDNGQESCVDSDECGIIQAIGTHFETANGEVFTPFGTTVYALSHQKPELIDKTLRALKDAPFNKLRHCIFPKYYDYNREDPELFPFEKIDGKWDIHHPCFAFWHKLEDVISRLAEQGIQSDLILFHPYDKWGFKELTMEENMVYLDYVLRRFAAIPHIWWSLANEFDLIFSRSIQDWKKIERYVRDNDAYGHLLSVHNCFSFYDFQGEAITHCSIQSRQIESASRFIEKYNKPVIFDECGYEGNLPQAWGDLSAFSLVNSFWTVTVQGAYCTHGEVFLAEDDVLWWAKGGALKGESTPRIAFLKQIMDELPKPIVRWEEDPLRDMDSETRQLILNTPFRTLLKGMPERQQESNFVHEAKFAGRVQDEIFIEYLGRHCTARLDWHLPDDKMYEVQIIDVWNMTRQTVYKNVSGKITIDLPGKEGVAVLARRLK